MLLSIIVPTYNEERTIKEIIGSLQSVTFPLAYEIIIVDDASIDRTYKESLIAKFRNESSHVRIFKNRINQGKGFSVRKGIRRSKGDFIIVQDADEEYSPAEIPKLLGPLLRGEAEVVYGSRFLNRRRPEGMAYPNWIANRFLTWLTNVLFGLKLTDMETCYKLFKAELVKGLPLKANRFAFEPEVTALLARNKVTIKELPINYSGRTTKQGKKIKARDFFFALLTLLRCRFLHTQAPSRDPNLVKGKRL